MHKRIKNSWRILVIIIIEALCFSQLSWAVGSSILDLFSLPEAIPHSAFDFDLKLASAPITATVTVSSKGDKTITIHEFGEYRSETIKGTGYFSYKIIHQPTGKEVYFREISRETVETGGITYKEILRFDIEYFLTYRVTHEDREDWAKATGKTDWKQVKGTFEEKLVVHVSKEKEGARKGLDFRGTGIGGREVYTGEDLGEFLEYLEEVGKEAFATERKVFSHLEKATITHEQAISLEEGVRESVSRTYHIEGGQLNQVETNFSSTVSGSGKEVLSFYPHDGRLHKLIRGDEKAEYFQAEYFWRNDGSLDKIIISFHRDGKVVGKMERQWLEREEDYEWIRDTYIERGMEKDQIVKVHEYYFLSASGSITLKEFIFDKNREIWLCKEISEKSKESLDERLAKREDLESWLKDLEYWFRLRKTITGPEPAWSFLQKSGETKVYYNGLYLVTLNPQVVEDAKAIRSKVITQDSNQPYPLSVYLFNKYEYLINSHLEESMDRRIYKPTSYEPIDIVWENNKGIWRSIFENGVDYVWDSEKEEVDRFIAFAMAYAKDFYYETLGFGEYLPDQWVFEWENLLLGNPAVAERTDHKGTFEIGNVARYNPLILRQGNFIPLLNPLVPGEVSYVPLTQERVRTPYRISYFFMNKEDFKNHFINIYGDIAYKHLVDKHTFWWGMVDRLSPPYQSMARGEDEHEVLPSVFFRAIDVLKAILSANTWGALSQALSISEHQAYLVLGDMLLNKSEYIKQNWNSEEILAAINLSYQYTYGLVYALIRLTQEQQPFPEGLDWAIKNSGILSDPELSILLNRDNLDTLFAISGYATKRAFASTLALEISSRVLQQYATMYSAKIKEIENWAATTTPETWFEIGIESFIPVSIALTLVTLPFGSSGAMGLGAKGISASASALKIYGAYIRTLFKPANWWRITGSGIAYGGISAIYNMVSNLVSGQGIDLQQLKMAYALGYATGLIAALTAIPDAVMAKWHLGRWQFGQRLATNPGGLLTLFMSDPARYAVAHGFKALVYLDKIGSILLLSEAVNRAINGILDVAEVEMSSVTNALVRLCSFLLATRFLWPAKTGLLGLQPFTGIIHGMVEVRPGRAIDHLSFFNWVKFILRDYLRQLSEISY